ncbi:MAG: PEGA domain-containing protein [Deltaproteobacteria bacterium]|nr:PEGA domain-containing protein [Deltaproteobacteria bacterium]
MKNKIQNILIFGLVLITFGCAAPLTVKYDARLGAPAISLKESFNVAIAPYKDERKEGNRKKLGDITSPVFGIDAPELIIEKNVSDLVTDAFKEQFQLAGFKAEKGDKAQADLLIQGSVKAFSLDIGAKDAIEIEIETTAKDAKNGNILWSGAVTEKNERFAGTMGNSRKTVGKYISSSLAKVIKSTLTDIASAIEKTMPKSIEPVKEEIILGSEGRLSLSSVPPKTQVFIDDVYYGLTPITTDLAPGIYTVNFKMEGFKKVAQKIAVRTGRVTEFAVVLEKE